MRGAHAAYASTAGVRERRVGTHEGAATLCHRPLDLQIGHHRIAQPDDRVEIRLAQVAQDSRQAAQQRAHRPGQVREA